MKIETLQEEGKGCLVAQLGEQRTLARCRWFESIQGNEGWFDSSSLVEVKVEKDDPGRKGSDLCSETVGDTELTYGHDPTVGQIPICMARRM